MMTSSHWFRLCRMLADPGLGFRLSWYVHGILFSAARRRAVSTGYRMNVPSGPNKLLLQTRDCPMLRRDEDDVQIVHLHFLLDAKFCLEAW